ncbi:hypothetical protein [Thioclava sp. GXIMD4216]|uniref:Uncharacterized protein n=1 Tax=Thioclava litoralis TaxID=3076557 RepID=A0ABZ1DZ57_9RHOB|nr:hypothetical protein RPE78_08250 [Thioclava sp. FTW29]
MQKKLFALSLGFLALILAAQNLRAETNACGKRADIVVELANRYQETRRSTGIAANNTLMELFAAESGSWTLLATTPNGTSCLIASGLNYKSAPQKVETSDTYRPKKEI